MLTHSLGSTPTISITLAPTVLPPSTHTTLQPPNAELTSARNSTQQPRSSLLQTSLLAQARSASSSSAYQRTHQQSNSRGPLHTHAVFLPLPQRVSLRPTHIRTTTAFLRVHAGYTAPLTLSFSSLGSRTTPFSTSLSRDSLDSITSKRSAFLPRPSSPLFLSISSTHTSLTFSSHEAHFFFFPSSSFSFFLSSSSSSSSSSSFLLGSSLLLPPSLSLLL